MMFLLKRMLPRLLSHIGCLLMILGISSHSVANDFNPSHFEVYIGDINGDGVDDVYLAAKTLFVPVAGDIFIPLWTKVRSNYQLLSASTSQYASLTAVNDGVVDIGRLRLSLPLQWQDHDWNGHNDAQVPKQGTMPHAVVFMKGKSLTSSWRNPTAVAAGRRLMIQSFSASKSSIRQPEETVRLSWQVSGADKVRIMDDAGRFVVNNGHQHGSVAVRPSASTQYRLVINNELGQVNKLLQVHLDQQGPQRRWVNNAQLKPFLASIPHPVPSSIREDKQGNSYVGSLGGNFYKVDKTGRIEWVLGGVGVVSNPATAIDKDWLIGVKTSSRPISSSNYCLAGASADSLNGGRVIRLGENKTVRWSYLTRYPMIAPPSIDKESGLVIAIDYCGVIYTFQPYTGQLLGMNDQALKSHQVAWPLLMKEGRVFVKPQDDHELLLKYGNDGYSSGIQLLWDSKTIYKNREALK